MARAGNGEDVSLKGVNELESNMLKKIRLSQSTQFHRLVI